jgi:hypothetical protein
MAPDVAFPAAAGVVELDAGVVAWSIELEARSFPGWDFLLTADLLIGKVSRRFGQNRRTEAARCPRQEPLESYG